MAKVTFSSTLLVRINIVGEKQPSQLVRKDDGLLGNFYEFQKKEGIYPAFLSGSGGGYYCAYFYTEDVEKIEKWLKEQKVRKVSPFFQPR